MATDFTPEQVLQISKGDPEIAAFIRMLLDRIQDLERQLAQNSRNSSKPPSSDGFRKPNNLRKSGGKQGAPHGHDGHTLRFTDQVDHVIVHTPSVCSHCSGSLTEVEPVDFEKRQVIDIPPPRAIVTEYRAEKKRCPHCKSLQQASFPAPARAPVQYGEGFVAWTAYLNPYQLLPLERIGQLFEDLTGYRPSEATLLSWSRDMSDSLEPLEQIIRKQLITSEVAHADETGIRIEKRGNWIHTVCNAKWTLLSAHQSRGSKGMKAAGVLPLFKGILVHDFYWPYGKEEFAFGHAYCNAHLLRECQGIIETDKHAWAAAMKELLQTSWKRTREARVAHAPLDEATLCEWEQRYDSILEQGRAEWMQDAVPKKNGATGRKPKSKAGNLAQRFLTYKASILGFLRDARIPFDNNQAERDLRMVKVKAKVSGTFRTMQGAQDFARIRSFISTLRKHNLPILSSLSSALRGAFSF